jgi:Mrp family chromosome partitioning ATPase
LRDRLITHFEINNMTHKPKLIAVTSCSQGAGVTSTAAGLAATLSETGDGNVLLVDMNLEEGAAHPFHMGRPACGLLDALESETRNPALVHEKLYLASMNDAANKLPSVLPRRFTHLVPKLKMSDYDYIIFDMPAISQTSITPKLARYMDMVLMVIESEKTNCEVVEQANSLLAESNVSAKAVLNKYRPHVPRWLQQEL